MTRMMPDGVVPHVFVNYRGAGTPRLRARRLRAVRPDVAVARRLPRPLRGEEGVAADDLRPAEHRVRRSRPTGRSAAVPSSATRASSSIQGVDLSAGRDVVAGAVTFGQLGIAKRTEFARAHAQGLGHGVRRRPRRPRQADPELGGRRALPLADLLQLRRRRRDLRAGADRSRARREQPARRAGRHAGRRLARSASSPAPARSPRRRSRPRSSIRRRCRSASATPASRTPRSASTTRTSGWKSFKHAACRLPGRRTVDACCSRTTTTPRRIRLGVEHRLSAAPPLRAGFAGDSVGRSRRDGHAAASRAGSRASACSAAGCPIMGGLSARRGLRAHLHARSARPHRRAHRRHRRPPRRLRSTAASTR